MGGRPHQWTDCDRWWLGELCSIRPAIPWHRIGAHFQVSRQAAQREAARFGISKPWYTSKNIRRVLTDAQIVILRRLRTWGLDKLAKLLRVARATVAKWVDKLGIPRAYTAYRRAIDARNARIIAMVKANVPRREIRRELGVSVGVIAGVCHRAGDAVPKTGGQRSLPRKPARPMPLVLKHTARPGPKAPPPARTWQPLGPYRPVTLVKLRSDTCRWPLWDGDKDLRLYCGHQIHRDPQGKLAPYCQDHYAIAYRDSVY